MEERGKERRQSRKGGREGTSSTCLNIKLLQEASDGLWKDKRHGQFHQFPGAEKLCQNTRTSPCPESVISTLCPLWGLSNALQRQTFHLKELQSSRKVDTVDGFLFDCSLSEKRSEGLS